MSDQSGAVLSAEQEQELLKPIESHIAEIQKKIDTLRKNGTDRVVQLQGDIDATKRDRILTKEERSATIEQYRVDLEDAKKVEESHEKEVSELISEAVSYLNEHFESQYLRPVEASCAQEKILAKQQYAERLGKLEEEHKAKLASLTDRAEIKDENYVYKNHRFDAKVEYQKALQQAKDRQHAAFSYEYHLIDLLRMSKFTFMEKRAQKWENYKYTFDRRQFFLKNGLYIVILIVFIVLCTITPMVKGTQLLTYQNVLNILQQASPRMFLALGVAGFFSARFKMHPFISTMANMLIIFGLVTYATKGVSFGSIEPSIPNMVIPKVNGFPTIILWSAAAIAIVWFIWNKTTFGKNLFAVGGNPDAAAVSGISVFKVTLFAFVMAGILYGFGSWLECMRMVGSGSAAYGQGWDMDAIAACVVGGVSFTGGIGKISGVTVGVLIFTALTYSLTILGIDTNLQFVFSGIIILSAVTLDCLKYVQKK